MDVECKKEDKLKCQVIKLQELVIFLNDILGRGSMIPLPRLPGIVFEKP